MGGVEGAQVADRRVEADRQFRSVLLELRHEVEAARSERVCSTTTGSKSARAEDERQIVLAADAASVEGERQVGEGLAHRGEAREAHPGHYSKRHPPVAPDHRPAPPGRPPPRGSSKRRG